MHISQVVINALAARSSADYYLRDAFGRALEASPDYLDMGGTAILVSLLQDAEDGDDDDFARPGDGAITSASRVLRDREAKKADRNGDWASMKSWVTTINGLLREAKAATVDGDDESNDETAEERMPAWQASFLKAVDRGAAAGANRKDMVTLLEDRLREIKAAAKV